MGVSGDRRCFAPNSPIVTRCKTVTQAWPASQPRRHGYRAPVARSAVCCTGRRPQINYLTI